MSRLTAIQGLVAALKELHASPRVMAAAEEVLRDVEAEAQAPAPAVPSREPGAPLGVCDCSHGVALGVPHPYRYGFCVNWRPSKPAPALPKDSEGGP